MAVPLISHPFRVQPNGQVATLDDTTDQYLSERLALILSTIPGERAAVPLFGINDPAYEDLPMSALQSQVDIFDLPVNIINVTKKPLDDTRTDYVVEFDIEYPEEGGIDG